MFNIYTKMATALGAFALLSRSSRVNVIRDTSSGLFNRRWIVCLEISWQLNDADGNNLLSGVAEEASGQICLAEGTYTFSGTDSYGDGWNGNVADFSLFGNLIGSYVMDVYDCFYAGDGSYPAPGCTTSITFDVSNEVPGCTDETANNYNPDANTDDGSCCFDNIVTITLGDSFEAVGLSVESLEASCSTTACMNSVVQPWPLTCACQKVVTQVPSPFPTTETKEHGQLLKTAL